MISQVAEHLIELEPQEHEVLINTVVVDFVPMEVENVEERLNPSSLSAFLIGLS